MLKSYSSLIYVALLLTCCTFLTVRSVGQDQFICGNKSGTFGISSTQATSDTIDILHYSIELDFTNVSSSYISGQCSITLTPKQNNIGSIRLDLLKLKVDSIKKGNSKLTFNHNDTVLAITLPGVMNIGDTSVIVVYYGGNPIMDASGWGGFYFSGNYAYNLGVGFDAVPHSYGRVWHPCLDNFVEKATYDFGIKTNGGKIAHCNGMLIKDSVVSADTIYRKWVLRDPIPSYLACVAAADYATLYSSHIGINNTIPIELAARSADTTNLKSSFANLNKAIAAFEKWYGPFRFEKVGYSLVPFSSGAMEHATNIAFPRMAANGTLSYETLMAHELSHHWWGDNATCETANDMWINEGWASFSEHLFLEEVYGKDQYNAAVTSNHFTVLQDAHIKEDTFRAVSKIPQQYTYGTHTYDKGASVVHNLRTYLGDSLFGIACKTIMDTFQFGNLNSTDMMNVMTNATGYNLQDYFDGWIFNGGFPFFGIDSIQASASGSNYNVTVYIHQKLRGAPALFKNVPMTITFLDASWNKTSSQILINGQNSNYTFTVPFKPDFVYLNEDFRLNHAMTHDQWTINSTVNKNATNARATMIVNSLNDSAFVRIEHNWVAPDPVKNNTHNYILSKNHYWTVRGSTQKISGGLMFKYNGSASTGKLDLDLVKNTEDSLVLLYRINAGDDWTEFPYYSINYLGSHTNQDGLVLTDSLLPGEYTFANGISTVGIQESQNIQLKIRAYPNPTDSHFYIDAEKAILDRNPFYNVYDIGGKLITSGKLNNHTIINTRSRNQGVYIVQVRDVSQTYLLTKLIKE